MAGSGSITMSDTTLFKACGTTGDIRLLAAQHVILGDIEAVGDVSLTATSGSITDADAVTTTNDTDVDVTASGLRLWAGVGIGETVDHLEASVDTVSARATVGGIYLLESDGVTVGDVAVVFNRVGVTGSATTDKSAVANNQ